MKTNALLAFLFFFLLALFASTIAEFVRDSDGHIIANGGKYYLLPQDIKGEAIVGADIQNPDGTCSLAVVEKSLHNNGNATRIESIYGVPYISTDDPLKISFHPLPSNRCTKHPDWLITDDRDFLQNAVMVGSPSEFSYPLSGLFYFNTYDFARHQYILAFCFHPQTCEHIAVKKDGDENRRLIVTEKQHAAVFKLVKTPDDGGASHISMAV